MNVLLLQHVEGEGPGLFAEFMRQDNIALKQVKLYAGEPIPDPLAYHALLVMGGPMSVYDEREYPFLDQENEVIQKAVAHGLPFMGICLGGQLLAKALGAPVSPNPVKEIGFDHISLTPQGEEDRLFQGLASPLLVFQWHGDTFAIPQGAAHLAASQACAHQAFRYGEKAYALQFHLEVTPAMLREWAEAYREELEALGQGAREMLSPDDVDGKFRLLRAEAWRLFRNFLSLVKEDRSKR